MCVCVCVCSIFIRSALSRLSPNVLITALVFVRLNQTRLLHLCRQIEATREQCKSSVLNETRTYIIFYLESPLDVF